MLGLSDLKVDQTQMGLKGSPTNVSRSFFHVTSKQSEIIEGNTDSEKAETLIEKLLQANLI